MVKIMGKAGEKVKRESAGTKESAGSGRGETAGWTPGTRIGLDGLPTCPLEHLPT